MRKTIKRKKKVLTPLEKEQKAYRSEISLLMKNLGYHKIPGINGVDFTYDTRKTELDSIFVYENIMLIVEDTVGKPGDHLTKKSVNYKEINDNKKNM